MQEKQRENKNLSRKERGGERNSQILVNGNSVLRTVTQEHLKKKKQGLEKFKVFTTDNYRYILYELYMPLGICLGICFTLLLGTSKNQTFMSRHSRKNPDNTVVSISTYLFMLVSVSILSFFSVLSSSY